MPRPPRWPPRPEEVLHAIPVPMQESIRTHLLAPWSVEEHYRDIPVHPLGRYQQAVTGDLISAGWSVSYAKIEATDAVDSDGTPGRYTVLRVRRPEGYAA